MLEYLKNIDLGEFATWVVVAGGGIALGFNKLMTLWKREKVDQSEADATATQFSTFQSALTHQGQELAALRETVMTMDRTIHKQQRTVTRLEMLALQLIGLVQDHGISVPARMEDEINDLVRRQ